jgi:uncharacterized protein (TIGR02246 family)
MIAAAQKGGISMGAAEQVARSYWEAEAARDIARVMEHYNDDATFSAPGCELQGKDQIVQFYVDSVARFPGLAVEVGHITGGGDTAAIEWRATFTKPSGGTAHLRGINVIETANGKFQHVRVYYDPAELER